MNESFESNEILMMESTGEEVYHHGHHHHHYHQMMADQKSTIDVSCFGGDQPRSSDPSAEDMDFSNEEPESCDVMDEKDPFSLKCRIPLPNIYGNFNLFDSSTFIKRRNERERTRVRNVNDGFERLRNHLPLLPNQRDKRLSKVETLRLAISYIKHLENLLEIE